MSQPQKPENLIRAPLLPKRMPTKSLPDGQLVDHEHYSEQMFSQDSMIGQFAGHLSFDQIVFKTVALSSTNLSDVQFSNIRLTECDLANAHWSQAGLYRVEMLTCRMTGFLCIEAKFEDTLFKECKANLAQFRFSSFKAVRFDHCDLSDADFQGANLTGVTFAHCDLRNVEMSGAKLAGADLRGCNIDGLRAGQRELQGAIIDPVQALALVQAFGIVIKALP